MTFVDPLGTLCTLRVPITTVFLLPEVEKVFFCTPRQGLAGTS